MKLKKCGESGFLKFRCPGCDEFHVVDERWQFDGNLDQPTLSPSILVTGTRPITDDEHARLMAGEVIEPEPRVCHSFVRAGRIEFLADCTHALAGTTADLPDLD